MKAKFEVRCNDRSWSRSCEIPLKNGGYLAEELANNLQSAVDLYELKMKDYDQRSNLALAIETLRMIAQNSYGTELCNSIEENNEILANHYFINQRLAKETLDKIEGK